MHESIRRRLEELLDAGSSVWGNDIPDEHLAVCPECSAEIAAMRDQAMVLRSLRAPEEVEPLPGFYARVMQRIEGGYVRSVWTIFADSPFGTRLAYASLTVAIILGSYVVSAERRDGHLRTETVVAQDVHYDPPVTGDLAHQRDAVLENIAIHQSVDQQGTAQ
jgi:hypothetical protein